MTIPTQQTPPHPDHQTLLDLTAAAAAAAAIDTLSHGRTAAKVHEVAAQALAMAHNAIAQMVERTPPESRPACNPGCAFCCAIPVAVSAPEALYIAARLCATLNAEEQVVLRTRLRTRVQERQGWTGEARGAHTRFCIFLREDQHCGIYPIRPLACQGYNSLSRSACEEAFDAKGDGVRPHESVREIAAGVSYGLILASKELGLEWGRHELEAAVLRALETPDAAERWAHGEWVFADCDRISLAADVEEMIPELHQGSRGSGDTAPAPPGLS